jgi:MFS family permease
VLGSLHGSRTELGLVLGARSIPNAAFILLGGVIADRLPRHAVMVTSNVVSMATQGKVAALLLTGNAEIWQLVVLSVLNGTSATFFFPASQGIVPQTVPEAMIQQANALLRLALNPANVFGAALGGALVAAAGPGWAIAIDAASFGAAAPFTSMLSLPEIVRERAPSIVHELAEGLERLPLAGLALVDRRAVLDPERGLRRRVRVRRSRVDLPRASGVGADRPGGRCDRNGGDALRRRCAGDRRDAARVRGPRRQGAAKEVTASVFSSRSSR